MEAVSPIGESWMASKTTSSTDTFGGRSFSFPVSRNLKGKYRNNLKIALKIASFYMFAGINIR